jgi:hypothetical protein
MVSTDDGLTGTTVEVGDNTRFPNRTARLAVAPSGSVYLLYKTQEGASGADFEMVHFRVHRSDDRGRTWTALGPSGVSVHGANQVTTYFTLHFGNKDKGMTATARSSDAWIATAPSDGTVYAAYVSKDDSGFAQLYVARSTDKGKTWRSARVTDGSHHSAYPALAVARNGALGLLYIDYDDSGRRTLFRHRFARSFDGGKTWSDQVLQEMDPDRLVNATNEVLWGDYEGLTAMEETFYGVFTGESIKRHPVQLDPIFFTETACLPRRRPVPASRP